MPFAVQGIDHVEVFVRDIEISARWYARVLGLKEICRWDPHPVMIGAGGNKLALFQASARAKAPAREHARSPLRWVLVAWRTDSSGFRKAQRHLKKCGIEFRGPVDHSIARSIYFSDPDGHPLEITCYDG